MCSEDRFLAIEYTCIYFYVSGTFCRYELTSYNMHNSIIISAFLSLIYIIYYYIVLISLIIRNYFCFKLGQNSFILMGKLSYLSKKTKTILNMRVPNTLGRDCRKYLKTNVHKYFQVQNNL